MKTFNQCLHGHCQIEIDMLASPDGLCLAHAAIVQNASEAYNQKKCCFVNYTKEDIQRAIQDQISYIDLRLKFPACRKEKTSGQNFCQACSPLAVNRCLPLRAAIRFHEHYVDKRSQLIREELIKLSQERDHANKMLVQTENILEDTCTDRKYWRSKATEFETAAVAASEAYQSLQQDDVNKEHELTRLRTDLLQVQSELLEYQRKYAKVVEQNRKWYMMYGEKDKELSRLISDMPLGARPIHEPQTTGVGSRPIHEPHELRSVHETGTGTGSYSAPEPSYKRQRFEYNP